MPGSSPSSSRPASSLIPPRTPSGTAAPTSWKGPATARSATRPAISPGARQADRAFAGGPDPSDATGKKTIPNITQDPDVGLGKWEESDIVTVLTLGMLPDGDFIGGEMAKVVTNATGKLPPEDVQAIATYLKSLPARR